MCASTLLIALLSTSSASHDIKSGYWLYGIYVVGISILLSLLGIFSVVSKKDKVTHMSNFFLITWNLVGACILTSTSGPFATTSNGYFGIWGMVLFSVKAVTFSLHREKLTITYLNALHGFGISSVVLLISIIPYVKRGNTSYKVVYIFITSILTISLMGTMVIMGSLGYSFPNRMKAILLSIFFVAWIILANFATFSYPFLDAGNGYFASWGGVIASMLAALEKISQCYRVSMTKTSLQEDSNKSESSEVLSGRSKDDDSVDTNDTIEEW